jgi:Tannase and feruloyl esterase
LVWLRRLATDLLFGTLRSGKPSMTRGIVPLGVAPEKLIGSGGSAAVKITRPLCPYPKVAHYKGHGDSNMADSFECVIGNQAASPKLSRV